MSIASSSLLDLASPAPSAIVQLFRGHCTSVVWFLSALLKLMSATAFAQDARNVLQAASMAMGANNSETIQYSGTEFAVAVGQDYDVFLKILCWSLLKQS